MTQFYYECHKCKTLIPGSFDKSIKEQVKVLQDKNNYIFECKNCSEKKIVKDE